MVTAIVTVITDSAGPEIEHDSTLTRSAYYAELMATSSLHRVHDVVGIEKQAFLQLLDIYISKHSWC